VIGTNKKDATETVELLLEDAREGRLDWPAAPRDETLEGLLEERGLTCVTYAGWKSIDTAEKERGAPLGKPRVKLFTWQELLATAARAAVEMHSSSES
jgi:ferredoxin--NADP+ reductase